jgi:hypothetical protein
MSGPTKHWESLRLDAETRRANMEGRPIRDGDNGGPELDA